MMGKLPGYVTSVLAIMWATSATAQTTPSTQDGAAAASPVQPVGNSTATGASDAPEASPPGAPEAPSQPGDVVVTGIRASLANALQAKRTANNIQEDLSAEDIGKLPDNNIADSLARLPGLSTNRDRGNPTTISIRGLPAELTNTLLNGREVVSGDASRNIRFDQYPAELITGASVYKSPTAAQVEGAIAGQVDLKTVRPLDYKTSQFVVSGRAEYNDLSHDVKDARSVGYIASASYIGKFANDTLGIALGIAGRNEPVATERTNIYRYTNSYQDLNGDGSANDNVPYGFEALKRGGSDKRIGGLATIEWRPSSNFELNGDFFYSHVNYDEYQRGFSVQQLPFGNTFSNTTVVGNNAVAGTATNTAYYGVMLENNNQYYTYTDDLYTGGLNAKYDAGRWHLAADVGYSTTTRHALFVNEYTNAVYPGTSYAKTAGVTANYLSRQDLPSGFSFNQSLTDPALNNLYALEIPTNGNGAPIIHDSLWSGRADATYDVDSGFLQSLRAGVRFTSRGKDLTQRTQYSYTSASTPTTIDAGLLNSPVTWSGDFAGLPSSLSWDVLGVANRYFGGINPSQSVYDQQSSWRVEETTQAGYIQADFAQDIGTMRLTGNAGLRVVRTNETSLGTLVNGTGAAVALTPTRYENDFTDWLPELNATLHIDDHQQVRFAVSKAMARAPLDYLSASYGLYTGGSGAPSASGGNPALKPYRADQVDLTYEHYFNRDTAATVSLFYKKLDSFIVQQVSGFTTTVNGIAEEGTFTQPVNGSGGTIKGVEVLYQQAFSFLPKPFDGFGIYANYSFTDSSVQVRETDNAIGTIPLPGLSKHVFNLALYYSKYGIDARVAYRYRSSFATQTGDTDRILYNGSEGVLSAQVGYEFPDTSVLRGVKLLVQADNLTNTPYQLYYGDTAYQGRYEVFGRRYYAGVTYRF